jgi:hypothetical protein
MNGIEGMRPAEFDHSGTELRRDLVAAVLEGKKIASASLREEYEPNTDESLSEIENTSLFSILTSVPLPHLH